VIIWSRGAATRIIVHGLAGYFGLLLEGFNFPEGAHNYSFISFWRWPIVPSGISNLTSLGVSEYHHGISIRPLSVFPRPGPPDFLTLTTTLATLELVRHDSDIAIPFLLAADLTD